MNDPHGIIYDSGDSPHFSLRRIAATANRLGMDTDKLLASLVYQATVGVEVGEVADER